MPDSTIVDHRALLEAFDGDRELLAEAVGFFLEDYPPALADIRHSLTVADRDGLKRSAHALKGMLGNFGAAEACRLAGRLEAMGRDRTDDHEPLLVSDLTRSIERLVQELHCLIQDSHP